MSCATLLQAQLGFYSLFGDNVDVLREHIRRYINEPQAKRYTSFKSGRPLLDNDYAYFTYNSFYDDLKTDPHGLLRQIYGFIGVDTEFTPSVLHKTFHGKKHLLKNTDLYNSGVRIFRTLCKTPFGNKLTTIFRKMGIVNLAYTFMPTAKYPQIGPVKQRQLQEYYSAGIEDLATLTGRSLKNWLAHKG